MDLIPGLEHTSQDVLILIAAIIAVGLFIFQYKGTDKVAGAFGPMMVVWFLALTLSGAHLHRRPSRQCSRRSAPSMPLSSCMHNGLAGFFVLSEVILCATGGEALYADMGHLGRKPIIRAWYFVFAALVINYLGQGAYPPQPPGGQEHPVRHGPATGAHPLHPLPDPDHHGHDHRLPGDDQRGLLHRLPGDHHPHHAAAAGSTTPRPT